MTVIIIDQPNLSKPELKKIITESNIKDINDLLFLTNHLFIKEIIVQFSYSCYTVDQFLNNEDMQSGDLWAEKIARNWFINKQGDFSQYNDISLGSIVENAVLIKLLIPISRIIILINKLLSLNYSNIMIDSQLDFAADLAHIHQNISLIKTNYIRVPYPIKNEKNAFELSHNLYKIVIKKIFGMFFYLINIFRSNVNKKNVLFLLSPSLSHFFFYIKKKKTKFNLLFIDNGLSRKDLFRLAWKHNIKLLSKNYKSDDKDGAFLNKVIDTINDGEIFIYNNKNYYKFIINRLELLLKQFWGRIILDINYYEKVIVNNKIDLICLYADTPLLERTLCLLAKKNNIKTLVIQHGAKDYPNDRDMDTADYALIWSENVISNYLANRNNEKKAKIVGNPLFEKCIIESKRSEVKGKNTVLILAHSFYNLSNYSQYSTQEVYLRQTLVYTEKHFNGYEIVFRPHPSEDLRVYQNYIIPNIDNNLNISIDIGQLNKILAKCSVVFCANSTAGIEAYLLGKDVYIFNTSHRRFVPPFDRSLPTNGFVISDYCPSKMSLNTKNLNELSADSCYRIKDSIEKILCED